MAGGTKFFSRNTIISIFPSLYLTESRRLESFAECKLRYARARAGGGVGGSRVRMKKFKFQKQKEKDKEGLEKIGDRVEWGGREKGTLETNEMKRAHEEVDGLFSLLLRSARE